MEHGGYRLGASRTFIGGYAEHIFDSKRLNVDQDFSVINLIEIAAAIHVLVYTVHRLLNKCGYSE